MNEDQKVALIKTVKPIAFGLGYIGFGFLMVRYAPLIVIQALAISALVVFTGYWIYQIYQSHLRDIQWQRDEIARKARYEQERAEREKAREAYWEQFKSTSKL